MIRLPVVTGEAWKYVPLQRWADTSFHVSSPDNVVTAALTLTEGLANTLVFINGYYHSHHFQDTAFRLTTSPRVAGPTDDLFDALSEPSLHDEQHITIQGQATHPLHCFFINESSTENEAHFYRGQIHVEKHSRATVVMHSMARNSHAILATHHMTVTMEEGSQLCYIKCQEDNENTVHMATLAITQATASEFHSHHIQLGGALSRDTITVGATGERTVTHAHGFYFSRDKQYQDTHLRIDHRHAQGVSRVHFKGIATDSSQAVYNGKIVVHQGAKKTDSVQKNKNLLLSSRAEIDTKPELEIYEDDVKCAHGATVGELDADALFYLQSRGIPYDQAVRLLIYAFSEEVLQDIVDIDVRIKLTESIQKKCHEVFNDVG